MINGKAGPGSGIMWGGRTSVRIFIFRLSGMRLSGRSPGAFRANSRGPGCGWTSSTGRSSRTSGDRGIGHDGG